MDIFRFYRDQEGWFIDLPDYLEKGGAKADLKIVKGVEDLLRLLAHGEKKVILRVDLLPFEDARGSLSNIPSMEGHYNISTKTKKCRGRIILPSLLVYIYSDYPELLYFKNLTNEEFSSLDAPFTAGISSDPMPSSTRVEGKIFFKKRNRLWGHG